MNATKKEISQQVKKILRLNAELLAIRAKPFPGLEKLGKIIELNTAKRELKEMRNNYVN